eukprot:g3695.t1
MGTGSSESEEEKYSTGEDQDEVMISIAEKLKCLARERFAPSWRWHLSREQEKNCDIVVTNLICRVADFVGGKNFFSEECMVSKNMCVLEDSLYRMNRSTEIFRKGEYSKWKRNDRRQRICDIRDASSARESYVLQDGMSTDETVDHLQSLLTGQILDIVGPILSMLSCHKLNRGMFNSPVDYVKLEIPDYPNVIKRPMDLGTIRRKLHDGEYPNVERVASDVRLVFSNAMLFNQKRHYVHRAASGLLVIFEEAFEKTKAKCAQKRRKQLVHRCDFCQHGSTCPYCMCKCRTLASPSLNCEHCQFKIPPRTYYYYEEGTSRIWCPRCRKKRSKSQDTRNWFDRLTDKALAMDSKPSVSSTLAPSSTSSSLIVDTSDNDNRVEESIPPLTKCFNGIRISESWVSCATCETRFHQACVLHNCWVKGKTFVCLRCRSKKKRPKAKTRVGRPPIDLPRAVDLPRSQLSDAVECRIRNVVRQEFDRNTPKVSRTNVRHRDSYQAVIDSFTFREVSRLQRTVQVSSSVNAAMGRAFPDEQFDAIYPAKMGHVSRALHLYQRIDGVDVIIFGMYVTEFSPDDPSPNRGSVYISYLDSVYYMRPRFLRTALYHSIMCEYLAYVKRRGHTNVHIWACPPMRSTDYVFHRHPRAQRTPGWERLRTWYNSMILRAHEEGTVVDVGTLYHDHFDRVRTRARRKGHAPPYLSQHFWLKQLASTVVSSKNPITNGPVARRLRSCSSGSGSERSSDVVASLSLSKRKTIGNAEDEPESKKKRRLCKESFLSSSTSASSSSSSPPSSSPPRATKLDGRSWAVAKDISNRLAPMAERLLVVRLQPLCESCGTYITKGTDDKIASWRAGYVDSKRMRPTGSFQIERFNDDKKNSASRLRRFVLSLNLLFVIFASEFVNDADCGISLRGNQAGDLRSIATIDDEHSPDMEKHQGKDDIAVSDHMRPNDSGNVHDHHPSEVLHDKIRPMGAPAIRQRQGKGSYDSLLPAGSFWTSEGPKDDSRPLVEFVMIVRDEAKSIRETIDSVKPWVDRWTILDTGSTDGTQDIILDAFRGVPGNIHRGEFVDFSTTRNEALRLAGHRCIFNLMLSGDETITNGKAMRDFLEKHRQWSWVQRSGKVQHEAYNMRILFGSMVYDSTRVSRTDAHWFYVGATHEYMTNQKRRVATVRVESDRGDVVPAVLHDLSNNDRSHKMKRWRLDLELLKKEWKLHPNKTRTAFYTAQSYECLGELDDAFKWYEIRHSLGGWKEEAYEALYRMGRVALRQKRPWPEVQQLWLNAYEYLPQRAEPLYKIASHYYTHGRRYHLAYLFASRAAKIPYPSKLRLFISKNVYDYKMYDLLGIVAYYTGDHEDGKWAVLKALETKPNDKRLLRNLQYYIKSEKSVK